MNMATPVHSIAAVTTSLTVDRLFDIVRSVSSSLSVSPQLSIVNNEAIRPQTFDIMSVVGIPPTTVRRLRTALLSADPCTWFYILN
jgi:hypothetical protein